MNFIDFSTALFNALSNLRLIGKIALSIVIALYILYTLLLAKEISILTNLIRQSWTSSAIKIISYGHIALAVGLFIYFFLFI